MAEHLIVVQGVVGSSPIIHPKSNDLKRPANTPVFFHFPVSAASLP